MASAYIMIRSISSSSSVCPISRKHSSTRVNDIRFRVVSCCSRSYASTTCCKYSSSRRLKSRCCLNCRRMSAACRRRSISSANRRYSALEDGAQCRFESSRTRWPTAHAADFDDLVGVSGGAEAAASASRLPGRREGGFFEASMLREFSNASASVISVPPGLVK